MSYLNTKSVCVVCGSSDLSLIASLSGIPSCAQPFVHQPPSHDLKMASSISLDAFQCNSCTHVQAYSPLVPYFKNVVTASSLSPVLTSIRDSRIAYFCQELSTSSPSIVELGMFRGEYLRHLQQIGYDNVYGIENCSESVIYASKSGINCQVGYLLDDDFVNQSSFLFDIVLCFNFLEHVPDPFEYLQVIKNKIASDRAILYFTMPSFQYISAQMLLQEFVPDHVSYFTANSLETLFRRSCLNIISLQSINNDNDLEVIASFERPIITPLSTDRLDSLVFKINSLISEFTQASRSVAFWGAGHRSLTLISQLNVSGISFIVDSAPFKQGTFCSDTGLPVVSPEYLWSNQVDLLLLSLPGIYASEVIVSLKAKGAMPSAVYLIEGNDLLPFDLNLDL